MSVIRAICQNTSVRLYSARGAIAEVHCALAGALRHTRVTTKHDVSFNIVLFNFIYIPHRLNTQSPASYNVISVTRARPHKIPIHAVCDLQLATREWEYTRIASYSPAHINNFKTWHVYCWRVSSLSRSAGVSRDEKFVKSTAAQK